MSETGYLLWFIAQAVVLVGLLALAVGGGLGFFSRQAREQRVLRRLERKAHPKQREPHVMPALRAAVRTTQSTLHRL